MFLVSGALLIYFSQPVPSLVSILYNLTERIN